MNDIGSFQRIETLQRAFVGCAYCDHKAQSPGLQSCARAAKTVTLEPGFDL